MKKVGFVITTHKNNKRLIKSCLESIIKYAPTDSYIVVYVNESNNSFVLNISNIYENVECIYIKNQKKNHGLTGTWNQGIDKCFENNCEVIVLSNHDLVVDHTLHFILHVASECPITCLEYYGPCNAYDNPKRSYGRANSNNYDCDINKISKYLVGFFLVFPKHSLQINKLTEKLYFDNKFPFAGNDIEWYKRFKKKGGQAIIVRNTKVDHKALRSWANIKI